MALDETLTKLAVLRRLTSQGNSTRLSIIEIWKIGPDLTPFLLQTIYEDDDNPASIEAISWGNNGRLFSCGGNSRFSEYDLSTSMLVKSFEVGGGPAWSMAFNDTRKLLVIGSDNAAVTVFHVGESVEEISFGRSVGVASSRVLSVAWSASSERPLIFAGCMDYIHIWNYKKSTCIGKLLVSQENAAIWSMAVYGDIIVAGDSTGQTSFWNSKSQVRIAAFTNHEADVLAVAVSPEGQVFSTGIDPKIASFKIMKDESIIQQEHFNGRHFHDISSMVISQKGLILTAGNGPFLAEVKKIRKEEHRLFIHSHDSILFDESSVLLKYLNRIEVFTMPPTKESGDFLPEPEKSLVIRSKMRIISCAIKGPFIAYRTSQKLVIVRKVENNMVKVPHNFSLPVLSIEGMSFLSNDMIGITTNKKLTVLKFKESEWELATEQELEFVSRVQRIIPFGSKIFVIFEDRKVTCLETSDWSAQDLESVKGYPIDAATDLENDMVWILLSNNKLMSYHLCSDGKLEVACHKILHLRHHHLWRGILCLSDCLIFYSDDLLISVDKNSLKIRSKIDRYNCIIAAGVQSLKSPSLMVVEIPEDKLTELLPSAFDGKSLRPFRR